MRITTVTKYAFCTILFVLCALLFVPSGGVSAFSGNNNPEYGYAFVYTIDNQITQLPFDDFMEEVNSKKLYFDGSVTKEKVVLVENGASQVVVRDVYNVCEETFKIFFPHITITKNMRDNADITDIVRLKNSPISGYKIRYEAERDQNDDSIDLRPGTYDGLTMQMYLSQDNPVCTPSTASVEIEAFDGSVWRDIVLPAGTVYNIVSTEDTSANPNPELAAGLSASIDDCSVNAVVGYINGDWTGVKIRLNGAKFTQNAGGRFHDVTNWFTNLPEGMNAMVNSNITRDDDPSAINIIFARYAYSRTNMSTPLSECTDPIRITVPFNDIIGLGDNTPWRGLKGGVVVTQNVNAAYNFLEEETWNKLSTPVLLTSTLKGDMCQITRSGQTTLEPIYGGGLNTGVLIPQSVYDAIVAEKESTGAQELCMKFKLIPDRDIFENGNEKVIYAYCKSFYQYGDSGLYGGSLNADIKNVIAKDFGEGRFTVKWLIGNREVTLDPTHNYLYYKLGEMKVNNDDDDDPSGGGNGENGVNGENGNNGENGGNGGNSGESGEEPQIWVNGKDDKRNEIYKKTLTKAFSDLKFDIPDDCKIVVSITETDVSEVSGAINSGKGKKSNIAKAAYKAKDGVITVTAGKTAGTARIWIAAVNKKKAVEASAYFDVVVGVAPKKLYVTKDEAGEAKNAVKSVALSAGDSVTLFANSNGTELSPYARFTWEAIKDDDNLVITPSEDTQSAVITVKSAPSDGKVVKASINVINVESLKKVKVSVPISNEVKSVTGLSAEKNLASALEEKLEETLPYSFVCSDGGSTTTDKIKVYTTTSTEEGTGYTLSNNKFKLTQKSKIKVSYKNGEFTLKAGKKTANGTKLRVLVVATHADKTVSVFESGVITIG